MADFTNVVQIDPNAVRTPRGVGLPTPNVATVRVGTEQVTTPQVTTPQVTTPQLANEPSPLRDVANVLSRGSDEANTVAQLFAKQAGYTAVTRDADGNLVVAKAPIVGDAAVAYHSAVKQTALSMGEQEAKQSDIKLSQQFQNDPDGYLEAANAYQKAHVAEYGKTVGPDVAMELNNTISNTTAQQYRFLVLKQQAKIKSDFDASTTAKMESLKQDIISLRESGGTGTDEDKRLVAQYLLTARQRVQNPVLGEPPEVAALSVKKFDIEAGGAAFVGDINRILKNPAGGVEAAMQAVESVKDDQSKTPLQRQYDTAKGQEAIKEHLLNQQRKASLDDRAQKAADENFEQNVIKDSASGNSSITENDIKTATGISPATKMRMLKWKAQEDLPEPIAKVSQATTIALFKRMDLPEGDPQRITSPSQIRDAYANGLLKRSDEDWLEERFFGSKTSEGGEVARARTMFFKNYAGAIGGPTYDPVTGSPALYAAEADARRREGILRAQKKDPSMLYDPSSPEYFGKPENISRFNPSMQQGVKDRLNDAMQAAMPPPANQRAPGVYPTPLGQMEWTGTGWVKPRAQP